MADDNDSQCFPLHECVFNGDIRKLSQLLRTNDVTKKDKHGLYMKFYQCFIYQTKKMSKQFLCWHLGSQNTECHFSFFFSIFFVGNTALHLAVMLGRKGKNKMKEIILANVWTLILEFTHLLLAHGAPVKVKNLLGWSPLAEAISFGDRQTSKRCIVFH